MTTTLAPPPADPSDLADAAERPLEQLEAHIWQGAANLTAAEHDWLFAVAEFDRRRGWERWATASCAHWLSWQVGLDLRAAREKVRVAHALVAFPVIARAMADGSLSYSKVRAITRIATDATQQGLVEIALNGTTNQVERLVSAHRRAAPHPDDREVAQWAHRGMWHEVQPDGSVTITLRLPPEQATSFLSSAELFTPPSEVLADGTRDSRAARRADGAVGMAAAAHAADAEGRSTSATRYLVTLHADIATFGSGADDDDDADGGGGADGGCLCEIEGYGDACELPIGIATGTARRLLCDADVQIVIARNGKVVSISDKSSLVTGKQRRLVLARDRCCQFPGCARRAGVDVHHLQHRANKGTNDLRNLTVLCRFHHHRLHEQGWKARRIGERLEFTRPDGTIVTDRQPAASGSAATVHAKGRTADDGRSRWEGDRLDLSRAFEALASHERAGARWQPRTP